MTIGKLDIFFSRYYRFGVALLLLAALYLVSLQNYLFFHTIAELFSITVSFSIFMLVWNARPYLENGYLLFLGLVNLAVGGLDTIHTLAYKGMNIFPGQDADLATQLWLVSRYILALAFLLAPLFLRRHFKSGWMILALGGVTALLLISIYPLGIFPAAFIEGQGLTPFKIVSEYVIILLYAASALLLTRYRSYFNPGVLRLIVASILLGIATELAFTGYVSVYDFANMLGHYFKIIASYLLYKAIIVTGVVHPYDMIFRNLKQREQELETSHAELETLLEERNRQLEERQQMIQALRDSQIRLRRLFESNLIGIMFSNEQGDIFSANGAFLNMIGYTQDELTQGSINNSILTPPEYVERDRRGIEETHRRGSCTPYEKEYIRKDGSRVPVLIGYAVLENTQQEYVSFLLDLTRQKKDEQAIRSYTRQLEKSNRELQDFAYVASHDLQEPLRKVIAFGDRLATSLGDRLDENERDYLARMQKAATRMRLMIDDLLVLSRVTTRARPFTPVDLNQVLHDVTGDLEIRIEQSGGRVVCESLPTIQADAIQMHQLFQNLISNALKFRRPDVPPLVRISSRLAGKDAVEILVEDNGIGFDNKYLDRIFQPFQRLASRSEYEGSGMGLAICQKIVERHRGQITANSRPGEGATFVVTLPVSETQPASLSPVG